MSLTTQTSMSSSSIYRLKIKDGRELLSSPVKSTRNSYHMLSWISRTRRAWRESFRAMLIEKKLATFLRFSSSSMRIKLLSLNRLQTRDNSILSRLRKSGIRWGHRNTIDLKTSL
jgi:hypothetical protein